MIYLRESAIDSSAASIATKDRLDLKDFSVFFALSCG